MAPALVLARKRPGIVAERLGYAGPEAEFLRGAAEAEQALAARL